MVKTDKSFTGFFRTENFKQIVDDYDVAISKDKDFSFCKQKQICTILETLEPDSGILKVLKCPIFYGLKNDRERLVIVFLQKT